MWSVVCGLRTEVRGLRPEWQQWRATQMCIRKSTGREARARGEERRKGEDGGREAWPWPWIFTSEVNLWPAQHEFITHLRAKCLL